MQNIDTNISNKLDYNYSAGMHPGTSRGPIQGFMLNVDFESSLSSQFFALQNCDQSNFIPLRWMQGRLKQRIQSRKQGKEKLGYIEGSLFRLTGTSAPEIIATTESKSKISLDVKVKYISSPDMPTELL